MAKAKPKKPKKAPAKSFDADSILTDDAVLKSECEEGLRAFTREAWAIFVPAEQFQDNWHVGAICEHLEAMQAGQIQSAVSEQIDHPHRKGSLNLGGGVCPGRYPGDEMAKSQPAKKPEPSKAPELCVLPMDLRLGDRLADERSEWQVIGRPYSTAGGKTVHVRVESVKQPGVTDIRTWARTSASQ